MRSMRVTVCQLDNSDSGRDQALQELGEHARASRSDLVLLPELAFTPWLAASADADPDRWAASAARQAEVIAQVRGWGVALAGTRATVTGAGRFNMAYAADNAGLRDVHAKTYLPDEPGFWEATWYDRGPVAFDCFPIAGVTASVLICTEVWFLEWPRRFARGGAELLLVPRATPYGVADKWLAGGRAAGVCAGAFCLSSNQWLPDGSGLDCGGEGWVTGPDGQVLGLTSDTAPFVTVEIDLELARTAKTTYPRYVIE